MEALFIVSEKIAMTFILMAIGYVCRIKKMYTDEFFDGMAMFITRIISPCFMVYALQIPYEAHLLKNAMVVFFACAILHFATFILGSVMAKWLKISPEKVGLWNFSFMFANIGFVGVPIISMVFGEACTFYCTFASTAFNLIAYTFGVIVISKGQNAETKPKIDYGKILRSPVNIASAVGMIFFLCNIQLPTVVYISTGLIADTLVPMAMIYVGSALGKVPVKEALAEKSAYVVAFFRLVFIPLVSYVLLKSVIVDQLILGVIIIGLATPVGALCAILASAYGADEVLASKYIFVSTIFCIFTIPMICMLFL